MTSVDDAAPSLPVPDDPTPGSDGSDEGRGSAARLTFIRMTGRSVDVNCPALYETDRGTFVVVGAVVHDADVLAQIGAMLHGEIAVEIPADVLDEVG